jgi:hypothetical protein
MERRETRLVAMGGRTSRCEANVAGADRIILTRRIDIPFNGSPYIHEPSNATNRKARNLTTTYILARPHHSARGLIGIKRRRRRGRGIRRRRRRIEEGIGRGGEIPRLGPSRTTALLFYYAL